MPIASGSAPDMPGDKWHKETYEESLRPKTQKKGGGIVAPQDSIRDESGWTERDDTGWVN